MATYPATNPTIFLRLKEAEAAPREMAWEEFYGRYAPVITAFARRLRARPGDVEDIVQDVMLGFFAKSPTFVYDPNKGRFRGYLKVCTYHALSKRMADNKTIGDRAFHEVDPDSLAIDQVWNEAWEENRVRRALDELRTAMARTKTFAAFERYILLEEPAAAVAEKLGMHINSVYRSREQIGRLLKEKLNSMPEDE
jgi:RNA polymerase sigma factor (sigma-70 family)